ncbi:MAG: hypothetical protein ACRD4G_06305, partial [Bryobacteraceae bacterium]
LKNRVRFCRGVSLSRLPPPFQAALWRGLSTQPLSAKIAPHKKREPDILPRSRYIPNPGDQLRVPEPAASPSSSATKPRTAAAHL